MQVNSYNFYTLLYVTVLCALCTLCETETINLQKINSNCQNVNMADAALARREARRKRILENSQNRLQLISNITSDDCCKETPVKSVKSSIPEQNNEIPVTTIENTPIRATIYNGVTNNEPLSYEPLSDNNLQEIFGEHELTNDSTAFVFPKAETPVTSFFEKFTTHKYDLVLLSILMQLLHSFFITTVDNTYFFLPLILYTTTKIIFFPKQDSFKYANILLLLNGMNPQQTHKLMSVLHWGSIALQDVCIYLFTTICIQSLCIVINSILS